MRKFLPYGKQSIDESDLMAVKESLESDIITRGNRVEEFEEEMASYCGVSYGVAFNSGSTALLAACFAADLNEKDIVVSTPNTFVATITSALHYRAVPVFVDIDRNTGNMDIAAALSILNQPRSRGKKIIMPVHFSGIPVDIEKLDTELNDPNTIIIEDAAHALGSCYEDGTKVGSCNKSHMTIFSFHPVKQITTGEGGMVMTNDEDLFRRLNLFRNNGIEREKSKFLLGDAGPWYYEVQDISSNYNFTEFQAALGLSQLKRLENFKKRRGKLVKLYREILKDYPFIKLLTEEFDEHTSFHLFVVQIDFAKCGIERRDVMRQLKEQGIGTQVHYIPVYRHPFFLKKMGDLTPYFPSMEEYYSQALTLPLFYDLKEDDVEYICSTLIKLLKKDN